MPMDGYLIALGKVALAALLGGIIGFERESKGQFAGFRTILLISIGSCLMMMLSLHMPALFSSMGAETALRIDPARIASYAIASMGFLGGGAIIKGKGTVRGLTTAASLWLVTGLGLAVGAGFYMPAVLCTGVSIVALYYLSRFKSIVPHRQFVTLTLRFSCTADPLEKARAMLAEQDNVSVLFINYRRFDNTDCAEYVFRLSVAGEARWKFVVDALAGLEAVTAVSWAESDVP